ncbi:MAG: alginate lyase family protein [Candidatus Pedobacter colombiensis]|uniref:Alginate lyase family protein n=1 Tax=Candidatus Pedobacter colombiensis TaxID=3121371 RepID=A0AAJ6B767_9SPHI|nr:alginate lyase family protein [Pedobacter sp.]WEK17748.1 MAG: alginate lyase family protein [Pedobacter sp.]
MVRIQLVMVTRVVLLVAILLPPAITAKAQYLSLNKSELQKLSTLINTDQNVKMAYHELENLADATLKQHPDPVDTIISEGHLANDPKKLKTQKSLADLDKIYALAYTYSISNKPVYLKKCIEYILAWAKINHGAGNPINDTKLDPLFDAYDLIKDEMTVSERNTVDKWLVEIADAEMASPRFKSGKKSVYNNWNSHRIKVVGNIAYLLRNKNYELFADTAIKTQILKNLYADGSGMDFEERDALHYHIYTLEPLLKIATVIKRATGINYFNYVSPSGSSIQKSVEFLAPFVTGRQIHHEFVNSKVPFDKKRADNKEPGYIIGANFKPKTAIEVLSYAAYFEPAYNVMLKKLLGSADIYSDWQSVLNVVKD